MSAPEPIAIVGIGCRFPGKVSSAEDLWSLLWDGRDAISALPPERLALASPAEVELWKRSPPFGGFLDDVFGFDAGFFSISPREAEAMDPQHRLLLQVTWEALEDAGVPPSTLGGTAAGVYLGLFSSDYERWSTRREMVGYLGSNRNGAAGRIAQAFNLLGPAMVFDTDRSSGLVAFHGACSGLWAGECDTAIAGAANVILDPAVSAAIAQGGMLAPDGRCKFADARADGVVRSEGVAVLVLRPLSRALAAGDRVYAVVRGGAVMASGNLSGDLMAPSVEAQGRLLRQAYQRAGLSPSQLTYVEAHGTGMPAGDRVELGALRALLSSAGRAEPCWVGGIKSNIGHAEACGGLAGLIKIALCASKGALPPSLHFQRFPDGDGAPPPGPDALRVVTERVTLPAGAPFTAGVSSFGLTGINAHVVVTSAPEVAPAPPQAEAVRPQVLCLSARSKESLRALASRYAEVLKDPRASLEEVCGSAARRRDHLAHRAAFVGRTREETVAQLEAPFVPGLATWRPADRLVFVFPGQGTQWPGMGRRLMEESPAFARKMRECEEALRPIAGWSLLEELQSAARFGEIDVIQPLLVAIEISLVALWESWGVRPHAVVGTSMGEVAAAHVAGALSLEDTMRLIYRRTRLMREVPGGAMAVIDLPADRIAPLLDPKVVAISAINSPTSTVISGERPAVEALVRGFEQEKVFARLARVDTASHSPRMDPILERLREALGDLAPRAAAIPLFSTVRKRWVEGTELGADYWVDNLRQPVELSFAIQALAREGGAAFVEISPHPVLRSPLLDCLAGLDPVRPVLFTLERDGDELRTALQALGNLHAAGFPVAWAQLQPERRFTRLPAYPWATTRYIASESEDTAAVGSRKRPAPAAPPRAEGDLLGRLHAAPVAARPRLLADALSEELARVLRLPARQIDRDRPLRELGLTSASGTELRATIGSWLGKHYPSSLLFNHPTVHALAAALVADIEPRPAEPAPSAPVAPAPSAAPVRRTGRSGQPGEPIAIVGMALRFPGGASSLDELWRLLAEGRDAITEVPPDRWDAARFYDPDIRAKGKMHSRWGGFVADVAQFDADLFEISPKEAEAMDPQQRLLLHLTWEALEHAGMSRSAVMGSNTGVFVGIMGNNEYARRKHADERPENVVAHSSTGEAISIAAGRLSYYFGLHGPALSVDTACSSSLVSLHLAVASLRSGECDAAIVGGVNVIAYPTVQMSFAKTRMLSPTGRCKTFDASADGYVRSEGACVAVLKPLAQALESGAPVLAVIRGTAVNQDGRGSGLTAPNGLAQEALIRQAMADAGVDPSEISYVEAHGTGTSLGDPIEVDSLSRVFSRTRPPGKPLVVGAVKANLGHLESCAGLAGVAKVVVAMREGSIPRQIHLKQLNPKLPLADWVHIPREEHPWPAGQTPRLAGVSSFGFSGTNSHVVLEEPPPRTPAQGTPRDPVVLCVSASTPEALKQLAERYAASAAFQLPDPETTAVAASAARREHLPVRAAAVAGSLTALRDQLRALAEGRSAPGLFAEQPLEAPRIAFLYPGGGPLFPAVTGELSRTEPVFRDALEACATAAAGHEQHPGVQRFALQYGLTRLWQEWGVTPEAVLGQGPGEYAAACAAGVMDLPAAVALLLDPAAAPAVLERPRLTFASGVLGAVATGEPVTFDYWRQVASGPHRFPEGARALAATGYNVFLEIGPGHGLLSLGREAVGENGSRWLASLREDRPGSAQLAEALAQVYGAGLYVAWNRFYDWVPAVPQPLPPYPFSSRSYWIRDPGG